MSPWKVILATMVIFGCGVVTGGLLMRTAIPLVRSSSVIHAAVTNQSPPLGQWQRPEFLRRMDKQLDLTSSQREEVAKILRDSQVRTRSVWDEISPQLRNEFHRVRSEIRQVLTTDQKKKWDELLHAKARKGDMPVLRPPRLAAPTNSATNSL